MVRSGPKAVIVAIGGFVMPFLLGFLLSRYVFDTSVLTSLFIGGTLTATSIGVTVRILRDVNRQSSREGHIVLGAAVVDDILGVLLLALLFEFSVTNEFSFSNLLRLTALIAVFFVTAPVAAKLVAQVIPKFSEASRTPGMVTIAIVSLVLSFAWIAEEFGAPDLLGGFAAGLALSRRFFLPFGIALAANPRFASEVEQGIRPIVHLFTPIFFVFVGLSLDLREVDWGSLFIWAFSISVAFVAIAAKILSGFLLFRDHWLHRFAVGMSMVPRGEVGLVFAEIGKTAGVLNNEVYTGMILVIAYTTLFSPFWCKLFYRLYGERPELRIDSTQNLDK